MWSPDEVCELLLPRRSHPLLPDHSLLPSLTGPALKLCPSSRRYVLEMSEELQMVSLQVFQWYLVWGSG